MAGKHRAQPDKDIDMDDSEVLLEHDHNQTDREVRLKVTDNDNDSSSETRKDEPKPSKDKISKTLSNLWSLCLSEKWIVLASLLFLAVSSLITLAVPNFMGKIVDAMTNTSDGKSYLTGVILKLAGLLLIQAVANFLRSYYIKIAGERIVTKLRKQLFNSVIIQEIAFFDVTRTGEILSRLSSDTKTLETTVTGDVALGLQNLFQLIGGLVFLFGISWQLTLVMMSVTPVVGIGAVIYGRYAKRVSKEVQDSLAEATEVAEEAIANVRTIRSFGQEDQHKTHYADKIDVSFGKSKRLAVIFASFVSVIMLVANGALLLVLWYGGSMVLDGNLTVGSLTSFLLYTIYVAFALSSLSNLFFELMKAVGATQRVFELMNRSPEINISGGEVPLRFKGHVQFNDVVFSYPSRNDVTVMNHMNYTMEPGKIHALVGPSGGGKSTITCLIQRFYDPQTGQIYLDGQDVAELDPYWLRQHIAVVSQEPVLFATSIRENICYGDNTKTDEEIIQAAKIANCHEFIETFPDGYNTTVGERGIRLSGGQKQRVAIARALLKNPKLLLLDEATSALDTESEFKVQQALERLMKDRTVLIIAHRLSTVKNADKVSVVVQGKIVEEGTHNELLANGQAYKELVQHQLLRQSENML